MHIDFLSAARTPLTKTFSLDSDRQLVKTSYPHVTFFTSHREKISSIAAFARKIEAHANKSHCLLKGALDQPLNNESRAGHTQRDEPTQWVCLDIDGLPGVDDPEDLIKEIPECQGVPYVLQYSSSMGVDSSKGLSAHLFMLLREPMEPATLKLWLQQLNLSIPLLRDNITLNRVGTALKWPLDITTCQNDKLLYIAPPILKGIKDPIHQRVLLVRKRRNLKLAPSTSSLEPSSITRESNGLLHSLRKQAGYKAKSVGTKVVRNIEVATKPDAVTITGMKEERGFVYFNLNGGDSWAYYHPIGAPDVIHNFKGEPSLATKDVDPVYHKTARQRATEHRMDRDQERREKIVEAGEELLYLGFRSRQDDQYYVGAFDAASNTADVRPTSNMTKMNHFLIEHGQQPLEVVPTWDYEFRFDLPYVIDVQNKFLNKYSAPQLLSIQSNPAASLPPHVKTLLVSILNDDDRVLNHFLNWLAFIYQYREKPQTAWLFHGTQGTGKNLFFSRVLRPVFGRKHCITSPLDSLEDRFNQHLEDAVFVLFNESDANSAGNSRRIMDRLNELITDTPISIRPMRGTRYDAENYTSVLVNSNQLAAIEVARDDRRFNVAPRQEKKLGYRTQKFLTTLDNEVVDFAELLASIKVDVEAVRKPLEIDARLQLQELSGNSIDDVAHALRSGDLEFFVDLLPESNISTGTTDSMLLRDRYRTVVEEAISETMGRSEHKITREQLHTVFAYCLDNVPGSPHKFTKFLKHHGIRPVKLRKNNETPSGVTVQWKVSRETLTTMKKEVIRRVK